MRWPCVGGGGGGDDGRDNGASDIRDGADVDANELF